MMKSHRMHPLMAVALMARYMRPTDGEASENGGAPPSPSNPPETSNETQFSATNVSTPDLTVSLVAASTLADSATIIGDTDTVKAVADAHPVVPHLSRLREKLNSLGSFVVAETNAILIDIENLFK
jgi:hypothetical protein